METAEDRVVTSSVADSFGSVRSRFARWTPTDTVIEIDPATIVRSPLDGNRRRKATKWMRDSDAADGRGRSDGRRYRAGMRSGVNVVAPGRSWQDCYYINRAVRDGLGLTGKGQRFAFDRGTIEPSVGDRVLFRQNNPRIGVLNSETGTVASLQKVSGGWRFGVQVDGDGRTVEIDPRRYHRVEYGYATTIHSLQGGGAPLVVPSITKSDDARSAHASLTRAMEG